MKKYAFILSALTVVQLLAVASSIRAEQLFTPVNGPIERATKTRIYRFEGTEGYSETRSIKLGSGRKTLTYSVKGFQSADMTIDVLDDETTDILVTPVDGSDKTSGRVSLKVSGKVFLGVSAVVRPGIQTSA